MKLALLKDAIKEIFKGYKRFLSILLMSFLGVGFFAGIRATSDDMLSTLNKFYKLSNVFDIEIVSTLGMTDDDINEMKKIKDIDAIYGGFRRDMLLKFENTSYAANVIVYDPKINKPMLSQKIQNHGTLPKDINASNWCLVDKAVIEKAGKNIGDTIELIENKEDDECVLINNKFKIIGVVDSPLYISADRGNNKLGSGKTDFFIYIPQNIVKNDFYTGLYVKLKNSNKYITGSDEYINLVKNTQKEIENIKSAQEKHRYNTLKSDGQEKIDDAKKTLNKEKKKAKKKIDDATKKIKEADEKIKKADKEILDAEKKIKDAQKKLKDNEKNAYQKLENARLKIEDGKAEILKKQDELLEKQKELNDKQEELNLSKEQLQDLTNKHKNSNIDNNASMEASEASSRQLKEKVIELEKAQIQLNKGFEVISNSKNFLIKKWDELKEQEEILKSKVSDTDKKIDDAKLQIKKHTKELDEAKEELRQNKEKLKKSKEELQTKEKEANEKIKDADEKLKDAQRKLDDLKYPKWHILTRDDNIGYSGFIRDKNSVTKLGGMFPLILFLIAALISLNSMTRMVEEQRTQLGTLKALGYSKLSIAKKYLYFASLATIIGAIAGMSMGFRLIPSIIWQMYELDYSLPIKLILHFDLKNGTLGLALSFACIIIATIIAIMSELSEVPSQLMRPKAPKTGRTVALEKCNFIWKRMTFIQKVTIRNLFRYKKRFLMTIIGVIGCTSLILSGFGLRDSVSYIVKGQYRDVFKFDMMVRLSDDATFSQRQKIIKQIKELKTTKYVANANMSAVNVSGESKEYAAQLIVTDDISNLRNVINIHDKWQHKNIELDKNKVYITDKLAELTNKKIGDKVILSDENDKSFEATVGGILENYLAHYVYISKEMYEDKLQEYKVNTLFLKNDLNGSKEENISANILQMDNVDAVMLSSAFIDRMSIMMGSLNYVVAVLIIAAGLLAFVVLFNLASLNISERSREIATIKVLGFYDNEVYGYLDRETVILTTLGILFGMFGGYFLNTLIVKTCEVDLIRFNTKLSILSFVISALIALGFSIFVNIITYFSLKKIDMIDSLKSVE